MTVYVFTDPELAVVDYLTDALDETVGVFFPKSSTDAPTVPFVQVAWDGTPEVDYPITQRASVRVTVWASQPTAAKSLAATVQALMLTFGGSVAVWAIHALTGTLLTRDPDTGFYLASQTFRVSVRPSAVA